MGPETFVFRWGWVAVVGVLWAAGGIAAGQPPPDYGFEWRTIGAVGNAAASPTDFPGLAQGGWGPIGRVDHTFRMARTEVTVGQYLEFVNAYAPYYAGSINDIGTDLVSGGSVPRPRRIQRIPRRLVRSEYVPPSAGNGLDTRENPADRVHPRRHCEFA